MIVCLSERKTIFIKIQRTSGAYTMGERKKFTRREKLMLSVIVVLSICLAWVYSENNRQAVFFFGQESTSSIDAETDFFENKQEVERASQTASAAESPSEATQQNSTETGSTDESKQNQTVKLSESSIVYITPTGERLHSLKTCAGKNAIEAVYSDVKRDYSPCGRCCG